MKHQYRVNTDYTCVFLKYLMVLCIIFSVSFNLTAQTIELTNTQKADSSLEVAINVYDNTIGRNSFLYTGRVYHDDKLSIQGHQYFGDDYWEVGEIVYDGQHFDSVYLMYDIYNNLVLLEHFTSDGLLAPIKLYNPKISSFKVQGHSFLKFEKDTINDLKEGFYDHLFIGNQLEVYVLRKKEITKSNEINTVAEVYTEKNKYYIKKDDVYFLIRKKGDIHKVLPDRKKEIKNFAKRNMLYYRQNPENTLLSIVKYYESLDQ